MHILMPFRRLHENDPASKDAPRRRRSRGQSVVEFALIVPVLLTITGAAVDLARLYQAWITLEGATRDAAEYVATNGAGTYATTQAAAQGVVCTEMAGIAGFSGSSSACTSPSVTLSSYSTNTSVTVGGSTDNPVGSATVATTFAFRTLFPYPLFTQSGAWTLSSTRAYSVVQGR